MMTHILLFCLNNLFSIHHVHQLMYLEIFETSISCKNFDNEQSYHCIPFRHHLSLTYLVYSVESEGCSVKALYSCRHTWLQPNDIYMHAVKNSVQHLLQMYLLGWKVWGSTSMPTCSSRCHTRKCCQSQKNG